MLVDGVARVVRGVGGEVGVAWGAAQGSLGVRAALIGLEVEDKEETFEGDEDHHEELEEDVVEGVVEGSRINVDAPQAQAEGQACDAEGKELHRARCVPGRPLQKEE